MTENKKRTYAIALLVAVALIFYGIWGLLKPKTQTGSKSIVIEVKDDQELTKKYDMKTDAEYLSEAMDELRKTSDFTYDGVQEWQNKGQKWSGPNRSRRY